MAALLTGFAALTVAHHLTRAGATTPVVVAAHDLDAGHQVTGADVHTVRWPAGSGFAVLMPTAVVGQVLDGPVRAGEPVTISRLRGSRHWPGQGDRVVLSVPLDPALAQVVATGDRVDVYSAGRLLTRNAVVSGAVSAAKQEWTDAGGEPRVLLTVPAADAAAVSASLHDPAGGLSLGLRPAA